MRVRLVREARIRHKAGEILEVSPAEARFLCSTGSAVPVPSAGPTAREPKKTTKKETAKK